MYLLPGRSRTESNRIESNDPTTKVSKLGFGCMGLTGSYNSPVEDDAGIAVITHAFRRGVTFFDTSDVYGPHANEILLGKVVSLSSAFPSFLSFACQKRD